MVVLNGVPSTRQRWLIRLQPSLLIQTMPPGERTLDYLPVDLLARLRKFYLSVPGIDLSLISTSMPNLVELYLVDGESTSRLSADRLPQLQSLSITSSPNSEQLCLAPALRKLALHRALVSPEILQKLPPLTSLTLVDVDDWPDVVLPSLSSLTIDGRRRVDCQSVLELAPHLERLHLESSRSVTNLDALQQLRGLRRVEFYDLDHLDGPEALATLRLDEFLGVGQLFRTPELRAIMQRAEIRKKMLPPR